MAVVGAAFLLAVGRALARIHVEHDESRRSPLVHLVDPLAGQIGESGEVLGPAQPLRLKPAHLAGRGGRSGDRPVADHPAHRRIVAQPVGVVHILVAGEPSEHRLPQQADQSMATVLAGARVGERIGARVGQSQRVVQLAIRCKKQRAHRDSTWVHRCIDWSRGGNSPRIWCKQDIETLKRSNGLIARKFDHTVDSEIVDLIDAQLLLRCVVKLRNDFGSGCLRKHAINIARRFGPLENLELERRGNVVQEVEIPELPLQPDTYALDIGCRSRETYISTT